MLDDRGVTILSTVAGIGFGVAGFASAIDIFCRAKGRDQEEAFLGSILNLSMIVVFLPLLTIILSSIDGSIRYCSLLAAILTSILFARNIGKVMLRRVKVYYPMIFWPMSAISLAFIVTLVCSVIFDGVAVLGIELNITIVLEIILLWSLFVLVTRFVLFARHLAGLS